MWAILHDALRASSKYGNWEVWVTNCGRNVSHHSGFVPMCQRLHIIELTPNSNVNGFFLSSAERKYVFLDSAAEQATSLVKLGQVIQFMNALNLADVRGPRSCSEWFEAHRKVDTVVRTFPAPGMTNLKGYVAQSTIRSLLTRRMLSSGFATLKVDKVAKWDDFVAAFPDQKQMLPRTLGSRVAKRRNLLVKDAFSLMEYNGPPEALSFYLCF